MTAAPETGVSPRSVITRLAAGNVSFSRNPSSTLSFSSTYRMPALAQPSSDPRYPAARDVFWWMLSSIFPGGAD